MSTTSVTFPEEVDRELREAQSDPLLHEIAEKLSEPTPELTRMWHNLAKRERQNQQVLGARRGADGKARLHAFPLPPGIWVESFLVAVRWAYELPVYYSWTGAQRRECASRIRKLSKELAQEVRTAELGGVRLPVDQLWDGVLINQSPHSGFEWAEEPPAPDDGSSRFVMIETADVLETIGASAAEILQRELRGKGGRNARPIRLIREMAAYNQDEFGTPLHDVLAILANSLFGTEYDEKRVQQLVSC